MADSQFAKKKKVIHPSIAIRRRILDKYYNDLNTMDHVDAFIAYDEAMHKLYTQLNPHLKYRVQTPEQKKKNIKVLRIPLTREFFQPTHDRFGFPLDH